MSWIGWVIVGIVVLVIIAKIVEKPEPTPQPTCPSCGAAAGGQVCDSCGAQLDAHMNC
jgi:hypothetical protein